MAERRTQRALTQKYDITALRAITKLEDDLQTHLAEKYGCEEDDVPVTIDVMEVFNTDAEDRRDMLNGLLRDAPFDTASIVNDLLQSLAALDSGSASDSTKAK